MPYPIMFYGDARSTLLRAIHVMPLARCDSDRRYFSDIARSAASLVIAYSTAMGGSIRTAEQDGRDFYDADTGHLIASYPELVRHDFDIEGAQAARARFLSDHIGYTMGEF